MSRSRPSLMLLSVLVMISCPTFLRQYVMSNIGLVYTDTPPKTETAKNRSDTENLSKIQVQANVGTFCDDGDGNAGTWVLDKARKPLYSKDCLFHRTAWNCGRNGRPGAETIGQWTWETNCSTRRGAGVGVGTGMVGMVMEPRALLGAMRGMRVGFIGDSVNENLVVSLLCILSSVDGNARKWKKRGAGRGGFFPSVNLTVGYHRAVLLSKYSKQDVILEEPLKRLGFRSGFRVDIDVPADNWINATHFYDAIVLNTGHWWGHDKFPRETPLLFYLEGQPLLPPLSMKEGLSAVVRSTLAYIENNAPAKSLKVWRLQSPRHFQGGGWNRNGTCSGSLLLNNTQVEEWFHPANGGENMEEREVNALIRLELQSHNKFVVLDVAHMSEFRADAHPDQWLGKKDAHLLWGHDCLHWCLPGLPDIWAEMLSAIILQHIQGSQQ